MKAVDELKYLDGTYTRRVKIASIALAMLASFGCGVFYSKKIPGTLFSSPLATLRMMNAFPVGASVVPISTHEAREQFERFGWGTEPALVVDYETVTFQNKEIMLCHVRTHRGTGYVLSVNPEWIKPF